jgi:hypothetical protein
MSLGAFELARRLQPSRSEVAESGFDELLESIDAMSTGRRLWPPPEPFARSN